MLNTNSTRQICLLGPLLQSRRPLCENFPFLYLLFKDLPQFLKNLADLAQIPGVKSIKPVAIVPRPKPVKIAIPSGPRDPIVPPDSQSTHIMMGVDKLHARGIFGKGIKIGIIDTGTDYTNPFLGGHFGPGNKIAGGYDFVGDAFNGTNTPMPDADPLDQCAGHGTHVAGIIGANPGNEFNISGVAYESTLFSYRVFGCSGTTTDDIIIEALLRGQKDGMDILTLSLGGPVGWTESTTSVVASRLARMGKIVTIAAGNDGSVGSWYTSGPSNGIDVISVASVDNLFIPLRNATTSDPTHPTIPYFDFTPIPLPGPFPIYATSNDTTVVGDACNPLPDDTPDLSKFLVIIRRGACTFVTKLQNIANKGAKVSLIYDNGSGFADGIETGNFTSSLIQASDGVFLVEQFIAGRNITISFPQHGALFNFPSNTGGLVSGFTSYGPTNDMFFKPAVAAPGGNIISTYPVDMGSFAVLSGTSMATPALAGCAALLLELKGKSLVTARNARTLFETTAQMVPSSRTDGDPLQTLTQQGAGLVNIFNAVTYNTLLSPGELLLNDTTYFVGRHVLTIKNTGSESETYKITHVPAGTALTIQAGTIFPNDGPAPLISQFATVEIEPNSLIIPPFKEAEVVVIIHPPTNIDETTFPVYSGFIQVQAVYSGEILHSSYQGLAAVAKNLKIIDDTDSLLGPGFPFPFLMDASGNPQLGPENYTFIGGDFPILFFRLASGSPRVTIDLVQSDFKLSKRDSTIPVTSDWTFLSKHQKGTYGALPIAGNLLEIDFMSRNSDILDEAGGGFNINPFSIPAFANGTIIPNGQYRILLRALKITGNPDDEEDYETYLSPPVGVFVSYP
ncbi:hypothetical protein Clacol_010169 [Clathrus columnatus]|uniref:Uncharacterized protein n=1 Tax=Clathrus columnatus TaxID=1419009 RepID=A0AAV5AUB1_9AGAM|nr:hypothetical protein Clacol_010169 [Clathrus columnatus]